MEGGKTGRGREVEEEAWFHNPGVRRWCGGIGNEEEEINQRGFCQTTGVGMAGGPKREFQAGAPETGLEMGKQDKTLWEVFYVGSPGSRDWHGTFVRGIDGGRRRLWGQKDGKGEEATQGCGLSRILRPYRGSWHKWHHLAPSWGKGPGVLRPCISQSLAEVCSEYAWGGWLSSHLVQGNFPEKGTTVCGY